MGVSEISRQLELVPSTCLHILRVLVAEELVAVDPKTMRYQLDGGVLNLARSFLRPGSISALAVPHLQKVATELNVSAALSEVIGLDHAVVIAVARSHGAKFLAELGSRLPALAGAIGRCVVAFGEHPPKAIAGRFKTLRWEEPPSYAAWLREVNQTRKRGYAVDEDNLLLGITVIAVPIFNSGRVLKHCVTCAGTTEQLRRLGHDAVAGKALATAEAIGSKI